MRNQIEYSLSCPVPASSSDRILLSHGGGGEWTQRLIQQIFYKHFHNEILDQAHDCALFSLHSRGDGGGEYALTTDSFVVRPLFFHGGDIGKLSIVGTVNDLAMGGAKPLFITVGFILEEGFLIADLEKVVSSMAKEANALGVKIIAGDTKVVEKGRGDGLYINTTGFGRCVISENKESSKLRIQPKSIRSGDCVIVSRDVGRHGLAVLSAREGIEFDSDIGSDCQELWTMVAKLLGYENSIGSNGGFNPHTGLTSPTGLTPHTGFVHSAPINGIHALRDLTRGGLVTALIELAESSGLNIEIDEAKIPIDSAVRGGSELLGLDPLYLANEGAMVVIASSEQENFVLETLRSFPWGTSATKIGQVTSPSNITSSSNLASSSNFATSSSFATSSNRGRLILKTLYGLERTLNRLSGEQTPRIC